MTIEAYGDEARERIVREPAKRSGRTFFERDRARVLHSAALRRLAAKTQVMGAGSDDFVRNRLTHSLEVAQVARELGKALGCDPDIVDSAALAHDLGHPPFGHNGEGALADVAAGIGGFEGNAQTLRILSRLEAKTFDSDGESVGLNLTRATLDACIKYPWTREESDTLKFGVYDADLAIFTWLRRDAPARRRSIEAQVMDLSDDIAYSVHDVEDGLVSGRFALTDIDKERDAVWSVTRDWYDSGATDEQLDDALARLRAMVEWPTGAFVGGRASLAVLKSLTSALIGRFAVAAQSATEDKYGEGPLIRYDADLIVPVETRDEIAVLKSVAAHFVMRADARVDALRRQRDLVLGLVAHLRLTGDKHLEPVFVDDFSDASTDAERMRVIIDQVASLTDVSAQAWAVRLLS